MAQFDLVLLAYLESYHHVLLLAGLCRLKAGTVLSFVPTKLLFRAQSNNLLCPLDFS